MSDFEYIISALRCGLIKSKEQYERNSKLMQIQASTSSLNSIRVNHAYISVLCVGCFSIFERAIQHQTDWDDFSQLCSEAKSDGKDDLANRIILYKDAVNAMKHGVGRSHSRLLESDEGSPFRVRSKEENFTPEDEMRFIDSDLVEIDNEFVEGLIGVLEETFRYISSR